MTPAELDQLRALAQSATPGPWRVEARGHASQEVARVNNLEVAPPDSVELAHCATDAAYIAAVSPDVVLALLSEVERLRAQLAAAEAFHKVVVAERNYEPQLAAAEAFHKVAERNYEPQLAAAEAFRLRADAERYRWLRDPANANADEWNLFGPYSSPKEVDAAIDAAMKEEGK